ncbi:putative Polycomb group protein ASXL2 isoform X2 [Xenopus laevis]|uniref:Polycomb group protein ASXL2 isoform X2 n=1 Tax=Xenopus laevis TaxID=8355 RepID=A0A8J1KUR8_XENLA|nr:putative Polycomb group protein ASXL2 isoform X2 [Xenopus laevis]
MRDAARRKRRRRRRKKKGRTWAEAAKTVLEKYHNTPMSHKEILQVIQREGLKEISGTSPLACLNAMLHTNSRGEEGIFYKVPGRMGVYTLKKDIGGDGVKEISDSSEDSSEAHSDSQTSENSSTSSTCTSSNSSDSTKERRSSRWQRKVASRISQPSSPQSGCPSPSIPAGKVISPSQKHSKKALKQALKQQQQRKKQQQRVGMPVPASQRLLLTTVKTASNVPPAKPTPTHTWEAKQTEVQASSAPISAPSGTSLASLHGLGKKPLPRSDRLQARHIKRTKCAEIDVETPDSILVNTNLRALINKHTFSLLPGDCQQRLLLLLPEVDRPTAPDGLMKLNSSALNNEFFTSASQSWKERLSEGEFTPEMQLRIRQEIEKEKKVESWKERFYESYYGENSGLNPDDYRELIAETSDNVTRTHVSPPKEQGKSDQSPDLQPTEAKLETTTQKQINERAPIKKENEEVMVHVKAELPTAGDTVHPPDITDTKEKVATIPVKVTEGTAEVITPVPSKETVQLITPKPEEMDSESPPAPSPLNSPVPIQTPSAPPATAALSQDSAEEGSTEMAELALGTRVKRKLDVGAGDSDPSGKFIRMSEQQEIQRPFRDLCSPSTKGTAQASEQKVPPLKIPVSLFFSKPFPSNRVSSRPYFPSTGTSPSRTGARTLADIKAKAQLARAQRAAAAAATSAGLSVTSSVPGPGPGGGGGGAGPGTGARNPADGASETGHRAGVLDMGRTGSWRGERGNPAHSSSSQSSRETQNAVQVSPDSAARAQLLQKPSLQPRNPITGARTSPASNRLLPAQSCASIRMPNPLSANADRLVAISGSAAIGVADIVPSSTTCPSPQNVKSNRSNVPNEVRPRISSGTQTIPPRPVMSQPVSFNPSAPAKDQAPSQAAAPVASTQRGPTKTGSSIPANNPLVTQLLQGKNVPMEQILPRPLNKVEMKTIPLGSAQTERGTNTAGVHFPPGSNMVSGEDSVKPSHMAVQQLERFLIQNRQLPSSQRILQLFSGRDLSNISSSQSQSQEAAGSAAQEQSLQSLIRKIQQEKSLVGPNPAELSENVSASQRLGFVGRRTSKPAMSGHYLLNVATYGRVPESFRRTQTVSPERGMSLNDPEKCQTIDDESESVTESEEEESKSEMNPEECEAAPQYSSASLRSAKPEGPMFDLKETVQALSRGDIYNESNIARDFIQAAQAKMVNVLGIKLKGEASELFKSHQGSQPPHSDHMHTPIGSSYGGTINITTSPEGMHGPSVPTGAHVVPANADNLVSFSVTVTTIPSGHIVNSGDHDQPVSVQAFTDEPGADSAPSKCYCRLKAMIICKGCGAFCHDDCIGPSKLCVSCLVVR